MNHIQLSSLNGVGSIAVIFIIVIHIQVQIKLIVVDLFVSCSYIALIKECYLDKTQTIML